MTHDILYNLGSQNFVEKLKQKNISVLRRKCQSCSVYLFACTSSDVLEQIECVFVFLLFLFFILLNEFVK